MELYTDKDMVAFGNYLLSWKRIARVISNPEFPDVDRLRERLSTVSHADFSNWLEDNKNTDQKN